jgi:hypothetical protein
LRKLAQTINFQPGFIKKNLAMKNLFKSTYAVAALGLFLSACTAGDRGSEQVADSVSIDTSQSSSSSAGNGGGSSESFDSSAVDTAASPGGIIRDTSQKDRSSNGAADFKPQR